MDVIRKLEDVWDNGESAPASLSCEELDHFKRIKNAKRVVARRWGYRGQVHQTPFFVRLLPDESGLVQYENNDPRSRRLLVLNGDESQRLSITVPQIDGHSRPERGYLSLPPVPPASVESNGAARAMMVTPTTCSISIGIPGSCSAMPDRHDPGNGGFLMTLILLATARRRQHTSGRCLFNFAGTGSASMSASSINHP